MSEHVVIVGAGVFGAWTAHHLREAGHQVTLVDMHGPAHSRASSGGETRLTRAAYGRDAIYTRMAWDSLPQWQALSAAAGLPIFVNCGVLFFSQVRDDYFDGTLATHQALGHPIEELDRAQLAQKFPMIDFAGIEIGLYEPGFGALLARRSVQILVDRFVRTGGTYRNDAVEDLLSDSNALQLASGETIAADRFVFALGPWLPKLFPDVVGDRIRVTRQEVFYFEAPPGERRFLPDAMPGWADFDGGDMYYGFPDIEGRGVKIAHDVHGPVVDPDRNDRRPSQSEIETVMAFRDRRFPLLRGAPLIGAEVCQYENSSNGDFLIDIHPQMPNVLLVGGGSGHGFKHGPEVGRYAARRLFGVGAIEPRLSLASKSLTHQREVH